MSGVIMRKLSFGLVPESNRQRRRLLCGIVSCKVLSYRPGVPKDDEKARELLSQAIEHGLPEELLPSSKGIYQ